MVSQESLRARQLRVARKIIDINRNSTLTAQEKKEKIKALSGMTRKDMIKAVEDDFGTRPDEFDENGKHKSRKKNT